MYFAVRSARFGAPALIWPTPVATARSAIVASSDSPERWLIIERYPCRVASPIVSRVSLSVPIWLTLIRIAFAVPRSIPSWSRIGFVTNRSSPTSWVLDPIRLVPVAQPSQSSSENGSSIETIG